MAPSCAISADIASRARAHLELDPVAGRQLGGERQIRGDHGGDLRIAAGRLPIGHQQNRIAGRRHLQRAGERRVRDHLAALDAAECVPPVKRYPMRSDCGVIVKRVRCRMSSASPGK